MISLVSAILKAKKPFATKWKALCTQMKVHCARYCKNTEAHFSVAHISVALKWSDSILQYSPKTIPILYRSMILYFPFSMTSRLDHKYYSSIQCIPTELSSAVAWLNTLLMDQYGHRFIRFFSIIRLLVHLCKCCNLVGWATRSLSAITSWRSSTQWQLSGLSNFSGKI